MAEDLAGCVLAVGVRQRRRAPMEVGRADDTEVIFPQPYNGPVGIAGCIVAAGIVGYVVLLDLYTRHAKSPFTIRPDSDPNWLQRVTSSTTLCGERGEARNTPTERFFEPLGSTS